MCHIKCPIAQPVIGTFKGDNTWFSLGEYCRLKGRLNRFGPRTAENRLAVDLWFGPITRGRPSLESQLAESARQLCLWRMRVDVSHGVQQSRHLALSSLYDAPIRMTGC